MRLLYDKTWKLYNSFFSWSEGLCYEEDTHQSGQSIWPLRSDLCHDTWLRCRTQCVHTHLAGSQSL